MVAVSVRPSRTARHIDDGDITLTNGRTTLLSSIPGGITWTRQKLQRLTNAVQAQMDHRRLIADLVDEDPDKIHALAGDDAWFFLIYGGRMFIDGDSIVSRSDTINFTLGPDGDLVQHVTVVD